MDIEELNRQIDGLEAMMWPLQTALDVLYTERRRLVAAAWIAEHGVTLAEIEDPSDVKQTGTYFADFMQAGDWLRGKDALKRFTVWNGYVYLTSAFLAGRLLDTTVLISDVKA